MKIESIKKLKEDCWSYNVEVTDVDLKKFDLYGDFLKEYNEKVNLTAIVDDDDIVRKHFLDSVIVGRYIDLSFKSVVDVGSGAGFPGVPLKIADNSIRLTLVDSVNKKVEFLKALKNHIELDYQVVNKRAEDLGRYGFNNNQYRQRYDIAIARAVKNLKQLSEYCLPLVRLDGYFVAMKGVRNIEQELDEAKDLIKILGGQIINKIEYKLTQEEKRMIILIKKISQTPPKYPRLTAQILKKI